MALAWIALNLSLFGVGDRADKYFQDVVNTHFWKLLYPYEPRPEITVLLLTDHVVNTDLQGHWPASYDFHGRVLKTILGHKPRAVFIDFMWLSQRARSPDGQFHDGELLLRQLRAFKAAQIPVYLAYSPAARENWKELDREALVKWVAVPLSFDVSDFVARIYPPTVGDFNTAAFQIAQDVVNGMFRLQPTTPMDIVWSAQSNNKNTFWMNPDGHPRTTSWQDILLRGHSGIAVEPPFNTTLFVRDLLNPVSTSREDAEAQLSSYIEGKIVLYGASLQGVNDWVFTPARTIQPGVFFHAMALDNLLNWGPKYKSEEGTGTYFIQKHEWISMLAVLPIALLCIFFNHIGEGNSNENKQYAKINSLIDWGKKHLILRFTAITLALLLWFGAVTFIEVQFLNYSASIAAGYINFIVAGFFFECTQTVDRGIKNVIEFWEKVKVIIIVKTKGG